MKKLLSLFTLSLLVLGHVFAADASGTWTWTAEISGHEIESTLKLKQDAEGKLTGTIDNRLGEAEISEAVLAGDKLSFKVVREKRRRTLTTTYEGKIEGDTITGTISTTGRKDKPVSAAWLAKRK